MCLAEVSKATSEPIRRIDNCSLIEVKIKITMHICKGFEYLAVTKLIEGVALETGMAAFGMSAHGKNDDFQNYSTYRGHARLRHGGKSVYAPSQFLPL
jgi:hypothetical protein